MSYYDDDYSATTLIMAFILIAIISFCGFFANSCTANNFENGVVVDKYRARYGVPHLIIEKNNDYGDIRVDEDTYFDYDIGETYAQE